jgi:hypothetical protein
MAAGMVFFLIDIPIRKSKRLAFRTKILVQIAIIILPIAIIYVKAQIINPRAQVIIAPHQFVGPYIVIFGVKGRPKLPREGRDIIVRLPSNGIVLTSSDIDETPSLYETYLSNSNERYGTQVFTELGQAGQVVTENCKMTMNFQGGYFKRQGDTTSISFDMNKFITGVHDSLCKSLSY